MHTRRYRHGEEKRLWEIFFNTVHKINIRDYNGSQLLAWAPHDPGSEIWKSKIERINPYVVVNKGPLPLRNHCEVSMHSERSVAELTAITQALHANTAQ